MTEDNEQWSSQMCSGVLKAALHFGRNDVTRNPYDEQITKARIEDQLWRDPGVAAPKDCGKWFLPLRQVGKRLPAYRREMRVTSHETLVSCNQPLKPLFG